MAAPSVTVIRKAYDDFGSGDVAAVLEAFDAAVTWHVPGHSPLSGDYRGKEAVVGFFERTMELSGGAFAIDVDHVLADGDVVVAIVTVRAERHGGAAAFPEVHVWRLAHGKVVAFREFQGDEQSEDRFWA